MRFTDLSDDLFTPSWQKGPNYSNLFTLGFALKCQVCESEKYGVVMTGVCQDKDDNGESRECQPHENLCFFTKTGNFLCFCPTIFKVLYSKVINLGNDTLGKTIFQKVLRN